MSNQQGFPNLSGAWVNPDGTLTQPAIQFFIALWNRTGGASGGGDVAPDDTALLTALLSARPTVDVDASQAVPVPQRPPQSLDEAKLFALSLQRPWIKPFAGIASWTPGVAFGGAAVGVTYTRQDGSYQIVGNFCIAPFRIILSSKGSSTGNATITGLPVTVGGTDGDAGVAAVYCLGLSGLGGALIVEAGAALKVANIYQSATTGLANVDDTNFTNAAILYATLIYQVAP